MAARIRSAGIRRPGVVAGCGVVGVVVVASTATVPRAGRGADDGNSVATLFGLDRRGQDHPRRLFTPFRPSAHVRGTRKRPLRRAPLSASHFRCGVRPCPVLFVTTQPAALGPRRGSFSSSRQAPEMPLPRGRASTTGAVRVPSTQPKGTTASGPTLRTGSVALLQANHSPLFTSSPARFGSRPPPLCAATASSGRFQRNGRLWGSAEYGTRGLSTSKDGGFSIVAPGAAWHPRILGRQGGAEWVGAGVGVDRGRKEQGDEVGRASHKMA